MKNKIDNSKEISNKSAIDILLEKMGPPANRRFFSDSQLKKAITDANVEIWAAAEEYDAIQHQTDLDLSQVRM